MRHNKQLKQTKYRFLLSLVFRLLVLVGFLFILVPFVFTVIDSDKSLKSNNNRYLSVGLQGLQSGQIKKITVAYIPVWIYKRSADQIDQLALNSPLLSDPSSKQSQQPVQYRIQYRSQISRYFVFKPIESIRSCNIRYLDYPDSKLAQLLSDNNLIWTGGFTESCFGSVYDLAGRRYRGTGNNKQKNLPVPDYKIQEAAINNEKKLGDVIQFEFKTMVSNY
jgi:ubiquinol-cytochrome c reductase iron-sulfur subunit